MSDTAFALAGQTVGRIKISDIKISSRQRRVTLDDDKFFEHINRLAESISRAGLIHPITLEDESNELVAGFCRVQAFLKLGHEDIPFVRRGGLDSMQRKVLELEENIQRMDIEWWMQAAAIAEIDTLQRQLHPDWNQRKTAEMIGASVGTVNQMIKLSQELKEDPGLKENKSYVTALTMVKDKKKMERRKEVVRLKAEGRIEGFAAKIIQGDAAELIRDVPDSSIDAVITNFPFGIDLEYKKTSQKTNLKVYEDDEQIIIDLVQAVVKECYRVMRPDAWFVGFFDVRKLTYSQRQLDLYRRLRDSGAFKDKEIAKLAFDSMGLAFWLEQAGFNHVKLVPSVWVKPNKTFGTLGDPKKGIIIASESFIFAAKGDPAFLKRGRQNIFIYDTPLPSERVHSVQMPEDLCTELVGMVALGGSRILDPFAGSGMIGVGALNNQCEFLGFELDEEFCARGNMVLQSHIMAKEET